METGSRDSETRAAETPEIPDPVAGALRSDGRCREFVSVLAEADEPKPLVDVAATIVGRRDVTDGDVVALRRELTTHQLPRLTAAGIVSYDPQVNTVTLTDAGERFLEREF